MSELNRITDSRESVEIINVGNLEKMFGRDTPIVLDFLETMVERGMPGADKLYTELEIIRPSVIGRILGRGDETKMGSPVFGYPIGVLTAPLGGNEYVGRVFLDACGKLWVDVASTSANPASSAEIVTELGENIPHIGKFFEHEETLPESSRYHMHSGTKFRKKPIIEVMSQIEKDNKLSA